MHSYLNMMQPLASTKLSFWKLTYPLLTTTFSPAQCNQIRAPILARGLPTAGFVWTFPHALVYGPLMYGGADIPNLHTKQTIAHILQLLSISYSTNTTAFLIQVCSEVMRLEAGLAGELLSIPLMFQPLITPSWLKHIWQMLQLSNICLTANMAPIYPPQQGDIELMCLSMQVGFHTADMLILLNSCWIIPKVFWLSDICNGSSNTLNQVIWQSHQPIHPPWQWLPTPSPTAAAWSLWQWVLTESLHLS